MRRTMPLVATGLALLLAVVACGEAEDPRLEQPPIDDLTGEEDPDADAPVDEDPAPGDDGAPADDDDPPADGDEEAGAGGSDSREITIATADAAERAGVAEEDVTFISMEFVTWSDGALGCPEPDRTYTQALVDGYRIVLEAGGERYVYHGAVGDDPFHCADPQEPASTDA
ncbi:MAG: hypothetical protein ACLFUG_09835 [Nitriliruptoraceae bacterium]